MRLDGKLFNTGDGCNVIALNCLWIAVLEVFFAVFFGLFVVRFIDACLLSVCSRPEALEGWVVTQKWVTGLFCRSQNYATYAM